MKDKALQECSYGRRIDSDQIEIHDCLLFKLDSFCKPVEYDEVIVEPYSPVSIEEVFGKKYEGSSKLLGDSNTQANDDTQE